MQKMITSDYMINKKNTVQLFFDQNQTRLQHLLVRSSIALCCLEKVS